MCAGDCQREAAKVAESEEAVILSEAGSETSRWEKDMYVPQRCCACH